MTKEFILLDLQIEINHHKDQCDIITDKIGLYHNNKKDEKINYYIMELSKDLASHYDKLELLEYLMNKYNPTID